jgi:hypothetical protein
MMSSGEMEPVAIDLDYNYEDEIEPSSDRAISDAKRRRLEEEARVNVLSSDLRRPESDAEAGARSILNQVLGIIHDRNALRKVLQDARMTMPELITTLGSIASSDVLEQLRQADPNSGSDQSNNRNFVRIARENERVLEMDGIRHTERFSTTVYVGSLPMDVPEYELKPIFGQFGNILTLVHKPEQGRAFITYATRDEAVMAQREMQNFPMKGRSLKTGWARGKKKGKEKRRRPI